MSRQAHHINCITTPPVPHPAQTEQHKTYLIKMAVLVVGATRGLGKSLCQYYLKQGVKVWGTTRKALDNDPVPGVNWITGVDIGKPTAGKTIVDGYKTQEQIKTLIVSAGYFGKESFDEPDWKAEETMYATSAIGPVFLVQALVKADLLKSGSKVVMVSSESGSIALRHKKEGGGNYAHHASKAALNMVTKLLSIDLGEREIAVISVHPGFMRTEMTKGVGFDKYWDEGGGEHSRNRRSKLTEIAVEPAVAAKSLAEFIDNDVDMSKTGQYWAPRGPA
jgi:NAD(P)-dependent dehydrogenase (short-subunit alcohol dehydrogenase family)